MKVLVVEDEFYARKAMIRQIKKYDQDGLFEISEASNGEEGWEFCEKYKPELVLTDIRMPKMDGIQLLQEIRNNELEIKVIILSLRTSTICLSIYKFGNIIRSGNPALTSG